MSWSRKDRLGSQIQKYKSSSASFKKASTKNFRLHPLGQGFIIRNEQN